MTDCVSDNAFQLIPHVGKNIYNFLFFNGLICSPRQVCHYQAFEIPTTHKQKFQNTVRCVAVVLIMSGVVPLLFPERLEGASHVFHT